MGLRGLRKGTRITDVGPIWISPEASETPSCKIFEILGNYNLQGLKYRIVTKTRPFKDRNLSASESIAYVRSDLKT